jgi:crotonobetainyl-CoA:carnitine CoA-transferase CaiB-like acyl-CoA transferase
LLKNILVLDLAGPRGSFCSKLLADLGAIVIKLEGPGGDPIRTQSPVSFFYENTNKLGLTLDVKSANGKRAFRNLIRAADVLVETFEAGAAESSGFEPQRLRRINSRLIHLSITAFGRTGLSDANLSEGAAASGFGRQACYTACLFGAVEILIRLKKRDITGRGGYFDLSIQEATASLGDDLIIGHSQDPKVAGRGKSDRSKDFSILRARDGYIQIPILRNWDTLLELVSSEGGAGDHAEKGWSAPDSREEHFAEIRAVVEGWTRNRTRGELLELGQAMGFPWASINSLEENLANPQLESRRFFSREYPVGTGTGLAVKVPCLPYKFSAYSPSELNPAPLPGEHTRVVLNAFDHDTRQDEKKPKDALLSLRCRDGEILKGTRVLDLTRMVSGPFAARILADFGAEVIKVQSQKTANGAESNDSLSFHAWNRNKKSIHLDLSLPAARDRFLRLAANSDLLIENYSPRVMANWGLGYERLAKANPDLVMVSISAMGRTGPWRDFVGFAPTFHALSGLISAISGLQDPPADISWPCADFIAGLYAALAALSALEYRNKTGNGQHVDLSAFEAMCTILGPASGMDGIEAMVARNAKDLLEDAQLKARNFFVTLKHPVDGEMVTTRSALWDWRRKPGRWKPSPLLGQHDEIYLK